MKTINSEELKKQPIPDKIDWAFCKLDEAQRTFNRVCKIHAPEPPLKTGDNILIDDKYKGKVLSVEYKPFALHATFVKWDIIVDPGNTGQEENYFNLSDEIHNNIRVINS